MSSVPGLPRWLGVAGLFPQLVCVAVLYAGPIDLRAQAQVFGVIYAALILSFLGGTWWGIAAMAPAAQRRQVLGWVWIVAILPSLGGLACFLPWLLDWQWPEPSLVMLASSLLVSLGVDAKLGSLAPPWWMALRVPLSLGLGLLTLAVAMA